MTATANGTHTLSTSLHPIRHWLGIDAVSLCFCHSLALTLANRRSMEIFLTMSKTKTNGFNMALKAD
jgi:hypothetical protein